MCIRDRAITVRSSIQNAFFGEPRRKSHLHTAVPPCSDQSSRGGEPSRVQGRPTARLSRLGSWSWKFGVDMTDFAGKCGLVVGVANKRSISWAIAQAVARRGARLALTYQGRFEEHVHDLSQGLEQPPLVLPCDVSSDAEITSVFEKVDQEFGGLDFVVHGAAFAPREELEAPFVETSRDGFRIALDI